MLWKLNDGKLSKMHKEGKQKEFHIWTMKLTSIVMQSEVNLCKRTKNTVGKIFKKLLY